MANQKMRNDESEDEENDASDQVGLIRMCLSKTELRVVKI